MTLNWEACAAGEWFWRRAWCALEAEDQREMRALWGGGGWEVELTAC